jgi:beta-glucanase (GH16 family)
MVELNWCGYKWITQERWGDIHPDKPITWYDSSAVEIDEFDILHLKTHRNPKYFQDLDKTSPIGSGLISCTERFSYGDFEIEAKLPIGKYLWPAFWLWSWDTWPPEIDIFEGYSRRLNYFRIPLNPFAFWNVQTNVHYLTPAGSEMLGGKQHFFTFKNPTKHFIKYKLEWRKDYIKIYFNDRLVRTVKDENILEQLSKTTMNVILNNSVTEDYDVNSNKTSDFMIKYFRYTKS